MAYDNNNIFAKILRGDIPCTKVYEDEHALAFKDIAPAAPVHVLVIPKGEYTSMHDFTARADAATLRGFWTAVENTTKTLGLHASGYRLIANHGELAGQTVFHAHVHLLSGFSKDGLLP